MYTRIHKKRVENHWRLILKRYPSLKDLKTQHLHIWPLPSNLSQWCSKATLCPLSSQHMLTVSVYPYWFDVNQCSAVTYSAPPAQTCHKMSKKRWTPRVQVHSLMCHTCFISYNWQGSEWWPCCGAVWLWGHHNSQSVVGLQRTTANQTLVPTLLWSSSCFWGWLGSSSLKGEVS